MKLKTLLQAVCSTLVVAVCLQAAVAQDEIKPQVSPYAEVAQRIGVTDVKIVYHRPGVKGRTIWGELVPYGGEKPWRAGANDATTLSVSKDVKIEGKSLPKGNYTIYFFVEKGEWTLVVNKVEKTWGSFSYDASKDVFRVKVKPVKAPKQEWLVYGFDDLTPNSAIAYLHWDELKAPFKIETE